MIDLSRYAMRTTATHVYFHGGPFSMWFRCSFTAELPVFRPGDNGRGDRIVRSGVPLRFDSGEKFMMAAKASVFGDTGPRSTLERIMEISDVSKIKALGRKVPGFGGGEWRQSDIDFWTRASWPAVTVANHAKFTQSDELFDILMRFADRTFVEGSPRDDIWGVKLDWSDPRIEDERNWRGENRLGKVHDRVVRLIADHGRDVDSWKAVAADSRVSRPDPVTPRP